MKKGIIGKKLGMTQIFDEKGNVIPVTLIEAGPCAVAQKKTVETDGYNALQLAYSDVSEKHVSRAVAGHFKKAGVSAKRHLKEFRLDDCSANVGDVISVDTFAAGEKVDITGITKGRGYTGAIKRWNLHMLARRTVSVRSTVSPVPWVLSTLQESSRTRRWPVSTVTNR